MLSNIELILLSLVNEKPSYAYEIDKCIETRDMRRWVKIGVASVYQVLERLKKKGMVVSKSEREGKMPERRRYYITEQGSQELTRGAINLLSGPEWYFLDLSIGLQCSDVLSPEELNQCLVKRLRGVKANLAKMHKLYQTNYEGFTGRKKDQVIESLILFRKAEKQFLENVLEAQGQINTLSRVKQLDKEEGRIAEST